MVTSLYAKASWISHMMGKFVTCCGFVPSKTQVEMELLGYNWHQLETGMIHTITKKK
jgi:hypothetical protein